MGTAAAVQRRRSTRILETGRRSAAGWAGSCDAAKAADWGRVSGPVGDGVAADGAAASAEAAAGVGAGSSVTR